LHSNIAGNVRNETDDTPFHEFDEVDFAHAHPSMFNRQNRNQKRELSERDRNKLRALTSFDSETDEWDEYLDMSFDDVALEDSSETDSMYSEMNQSGAASGIEIEQSKDPILNGAAVASTLDFTSPQIQRKLHATNVDRADGFVDDKAKKEQADRTSLGPPPEEDLKLEETSTNKMDVSEFRKKFQAKSAVEIEPLTTEPQTSLKSPRTRISSEQIEEIKTSISIVDAIESYNLPNFARTNAHSAKACCPFHDDNNPSMSIDDNRGLYKCFACGAGGDLYNFIREYDALDGKKEKMGFMQAVQYAAKEFGGSRVADIGDYLIQPTDWNDNISNETKEKVIEKEKRKDR
jgi:DNA primase